MSLNPKIVSLFILATLYFSPELQVVLFVSFEISSKLSENFISKSFKLTLLKGTLLVANNVLKCSKFKLNP